MFDCCWVRFVLSALGLYPVTPGTRGYVLGSPVFKHVRISRDERANKYENYYEMGSLDGENILFGIFLYMRL